MNYERFLPALCEYRTDASSTALTMERFGTLAVEYAPFDYIEHNAELAIVGLTPGRLQATNALTALAAQLRMGTPIELAFKAAKQTASFSGPMRSNLVAMLDIIGVPAIYGRGSAADFFTDKTGLVHFTSALRYPVFANGQNYSGTALNPIGLRKMVETYLAEEVLALPRATWVPLGQHAEAALLHLCRQGQLARENILAGLPHPSGANAERISYFLGRKTKETLSAKTNADRLDEAKRALITQVQKIRRREHDE